MRLSPTTAKGLMGVGGGTISIDGVVPPSLIGAPGGGWGWMDDGTCAGQADLGGGFSLFQLVLPNTITALDPAGASQFRAGNSKWAASLNPSVRSNILATLPLAGLGDIDETGPDDRGAELRGRHRTGHVFRRWRNASGRSHQP